MATRALGSVKATDTVLLTSVNLATEITGTLSPANGGTGQTTYTNGQLLIGNTTGNTLTKATLTAGDGVSITNGGGSITIAVSPTVAVSQASHGFAVKDAIYYNGTSYAKAKADAAGTLGLFIVSAVADSNNFTAQYSGVITGLSGLTAGQYYYVSAATAGALTTTEPGVGNYSNPILFALSTASGIVLPFRPSSVVDAEAATLDALLPYIIALS